MIGVRAGSSAAVEASPVAFRPIRDPPEESNAKTRRRKGWKTSAPLRLRAFALIPQFPIRYWGRSPSSPRRRPAIASLFSRLKD
jgi:hypothetical protein